MLKVIRNPHPTGAAGAHQDLARKGDLCNLVLDEAHGLLEIRRFGGALNQLIVRAELLLEEMDDILVGLDPTRYGPDFAAAASLHRRLEHVQAAIAAEGRCAPPRLVCGQAHSDAHLAARGTRVSPTRDSKPGPADRA